MLTSNEEEPAFQILNYLKFYELLEWLWKSFNHLWCFGPKKKQKTYCFNVALYNGIFDEMLIRNWWTQKTYRLKKGVICKCV